MPGSAALWADTDAGWVCNSACLETFERDSFGLAQLDALDNLASSHTPSADSQAERIQFASVDGIAAVGLVGRLAVIAGISFVWFGLIEYNMAADLTPDNSARIVHLAVENPGHIALPAAGKSDQIDCSAE